MPCNDVTELIRISLDRDERLTAYSLAKQTCGGAVAGRGLIRDWVKHRLIKDILALSIGSLVDGSAADDLTTYLRLKHLFALQATLRAYTGSPPEADAELVEITSAEHSEDSTNHNRPAATRTADREKYEPAVCVEMPAGAVWSNSPFECHSSPEKCGPPRVELGTHGFSVRCSTN